MFTLTARMSANSLFTTNLRHFRHASSVFTRSLSALPQDHIQPTDWDKYTLVKAKIYDKKEDVPSEVSRTQIRRARDYMRIRISIAMVVLGVIGSFSMVLLGRYQRRQGVSVSGQYMDRQTELRQQGIEEENRKKNNT